MTKAGTSHAYNVQTPSWVKDAVFYQIFPDRFAKSALVPKPANLESWDSPPTFHGFKGGDLLGVVEHLDYLEDLGITAIYFNPVFASTANHRYHTYDYWNVDPILGGNSALRTLLDEAHRRGMKVILDGVFNHASRGFFQFNHLLENGPYSPYVNWFHVRAWPLNAYDPSQQPNYAAWWNLPALPKFNTEDKEVRDFLFDVAEFWIKFGVDGWRLDVPSEINDDAFWREFRARVKAANPEAYIVGEIWHDARRWLQGDQFDAVMNYLFTKLCIEFFIGDTVEPELVRGTSLWPIHTMPPEEFARAVDELLDLYERPVTEAQFNLVDSHDTARFLTLARGDETALRLATLMQMVYPGAPCVYYGDEIGLEGGKDPHSRAGFPWGSDAWNKDLKAYFKKVIALRHAHPALRQGNYRTIYAQDSVYALCRTLGDDLVIVAFNVGRGIVDITLPVDGLVADGTVMEDPLKKGRVTVSDGKIRLPLLPRAGVALERVGK